MNSRYRYLGKNVLIFAISSFGTKVLSFFLVPLYTNILTTAEYGTADIITTTAILMGYILTLNIADSVLRFALEKRESGKAILSYGLRILTIGSVIAAAGLLAAWKLNVFRWQWYCYLFLWGYYYFTSLYQILSNYLRAEDKVVQVALAGIIVTLVMILSNILFLLVIPIGIVGYLISMVAGPLAASFYCMVTAHVSPRDFFTAGGSAPLRREMRAYSAPLMLNSIALWINTFLDKYFVLAILGVAQNGIYAVSYKIPTILSTCYTVFNQAWNLSAIKEINAEDSGSFYSATYKVYNAFICLACSGIILINIPISRLLFAKEFFAAWQYASALLIAIMFNALTAFLGSIFSAIKKTNLVASTTIAAAAINTLGNFLLIPSCGVQGAAIATAISYGVMWAIRVFMLNKHIHLSLNLKKDLIVYMLLILQSVLEHTPDHCYAGQALCFAAIAALYFRELKPLAKAFLDKTLRKVRI